MSSKFNKYITDPSTDIVDENGEVLETHEFVVPQLDKNGHEVLSDVTLVATADLRPLSLGERVRRYMRTPQFLEDMHNEAGLDESDDVPDSLPDNDAPPPTPEERRAAQKKAAQAKKAADDEKRKQDEIDAEKAENAKFTKRYHQLKKEGALPPDTDGAERSPPTRSEA